jgi:hypothetical protein
VQGTIEKIGEFVELSDAGSALSDASSSIVDSGLDVSTYLLLLLNLAYRELFQSE